MRLHTEVNWVRYILHWLQKPKHHNQNEVDLGVTSHSRSPDGGECGIRGGILVEMGTETPQSQQSIEIQGVHNTTKHVDRDCAHLQVLSSDQVVRSGLPAAWSPWALSP